MNAAKSTGKFSSGLFNGVIAGIPWQWLFSIFFIILISFSSILTSLKEKTMKPLIKDVGGIIFSQDYIISKQVDNVILNKDKLIYTEIGLSKWEKTKIFFKKITGYLKIFGAIYLLYAFATLIFKLIQWFPGSDASQQGLHLLYTFLIIGLLEFVFVASIYNDGRDYINWQETIKASIPFQGIYKLVKETPTLLSILRNKIVVNFENNLYTDEIVANNITKGSINI